MSMSESENLRETDYLAYIYNELYKGENEKDTPEDHEYLNNMVEFLETYIAPKYDRHDIITLYENAKAMYQQTCETRGFKRGVEFASRFYDAMENPCCLSDYEAYKKYEWMREPIREKEAAPDETE